MPVPERTKSCFCVCLRIRGLVKTPFSSWVVGMFGITILITIYRLTNEAGFL